MSAVLLARIHLFPYTGGSGDDGSFELAANRWPLESGTLTLASTMYIGLPLGRLCARRERVELVKLAAIFVSPPPVIVACRASQSDQRTARPATSK